MVQSQRRRRKRIQTLRESDSDSDDRTLQQQKNKTVTNTNSTSTLQKRKRLRYESTEKATAVPWNCQVCTYVNENNSTACEMCETARPPVKFLSKEHDKKKKNTKRRDKTVLLSHWITSKESQSKETSDIPETIEIIDSCSSPEGQTEGIRSLTKMVSSRLANSRIDITNYTPEIEDLCLPTKKRNEIIEWLQSYACSNPQHYDSLPPKRILIICGPSGCGKSTAVRCIARKLGIRVNEWNDSTDTSWHTKNSSRSRQYSVPCTSRIVDFCDFLQRSISYTGLQLALDPTHKEAMNRSVFNSGQIILIEQWRHTVNDEADLWNSKLKDIFRQITNPGTRGLRYPIVCVVSGLRDKKVDISYLSRIFSTQAIESTYTTILHVNAVTSTQMKKCLSKALLEHDAPHLFPSNTLQRIVDSSNGDMRQAIYRLQIMLINQKHKSSTKSLEDKHKNSIIPMPNRKQDKNRSNQQYKLSLDPFLSEYRIVGKILNGKILCDQIKNEVDVPSSGTGVNEYADTSAYYDVMLEASSIPVKHILELVQENYVSYYCDIEDAASVSELFSYCGAMLNDSWKSTKVSTSETVKAAQDMVYAIVIRSVGTTNRSPSVRTFRPIVGTKSFTTNKNIDRIQNELRNEKSDSFVPGFILSNDNYALDVNPYRNILFEKARYANCKGQMMQEAEIENSWTKNNAIEEISDEDI